MIAIVDYKMGNLRSLMNALAALNTQGVVTNRPNEIERARAIILPGVGAFPEAMKNLKELGLTSLIREQVLGMKKPILGICLGMQLLAEDSTENQFQEGLSIVPGHVRKIEIPDDMNLPHVGWNEILFKKHDSRLLTMVQEKTHYYFDHTYELICEDDLVTSIFQYGKSIVASIEFENIFGTQFHPEKSQNNGLRILRGFLNYLDTRKQPGFPLSSASEHNRHNGGVLIRNQQEGT